MELNIDKGIEEYKNTKDAVLLDVRTDAEYSDGHIPNSIHHPLDQINTIRLDKNLPIFVYCRSGRRSGMAVEQMIQMGYQNVKNIGGILDYTGPIEK